MISAGLRSRIVTALLLAPLAIAAIILLDTLWVHIGLLALVGLAAREWARFAWLEASHMRIVYPLLVIVAALALWWVLIFGVVMPVLLLGLLWWGLVLLWLVFYASAGFPAGQWGKAAAGLFVFLPALHGLVWLHGQSPWWLLGVLLMIWSADVGAYFSGKRWGNRKLAPKVSPGKTWAGVWGGLGLTLVLTLLVAMLVFDQPSRIAGLVLLVLPVVAFSIVGDLFESLMKRQAGMKDSGRMLPGHGGVMDRFDSLFAATPVFACGVWMLV